MIGENLLVYTEDCDIPIKAFEYDASGAAESGIAYELQMMEVYLN